MVDGEGQGGTSVQLTPPDAPEDPNFEFDIPEESEASQEPSAQPGQAPGQPAQPATGEQPTQPRDAAQPPSEPGQPPAATAPAAPTPFTFRGDERDYELTGATVGPDGSLTVPAESVEALRGLLGEGIAHRGSWRAREEQYQQALQVERQRGLDREKQVVDREKRAQGMINALENLRKQGPEKVAEWLDNLDRNWDLMVARANEQALKERLAGFEAQQNEAVLDRQGQEMAPRLDSALTSYLTQLGQREDYQGVNLRGIYDRILGDPTLLDLCFFEADENLARQFNVPVGTPMVNYNAIEGFVRHEAELRRSIGDAARSNAAQARPMPPSVGAAGHAAPAEDTGAGHKPRFKNAQERDEYFDSGQVFRDLAAQR